MAWRAPSDRIGNSESYSLELSHLAMDIVKKGYATDHFRSQAKGLRVASLKAAPSGWRSGWRKLEGRRAAKRRKLVAAQTDMKVVTRRGKAIAAAEKSEARRVAVALGEDAEVKPAEESGGADIQAGEGDEAGRPGADDDEDHDNGSKKKSEDSRHRGRPRDRNKRNNRRRKRR